MINEVITFEYVIQNLRDTLRVISAFIWFHVHDNIHRIFYTNFFRDGTKKPTTFSVYRHIFVFSAKKEYYINVEYIHEIAIFCSEFITKNILSHCTYKKENNKIEKII